MMTGKTMDEQTYTTADVSSLYNITEQTVRTWANEFEMYFSPSANPGHRRTRLFSPSDMQIMALVAELKGKRKTFDEIAFSIENGQRGDLPAMPAELRQVKISETERRLTERISWLQQQLEHAQLLLEQAEKDKQLLYKTQAELEVKSKRLEQTEQQLADLRKQQNELYESIGELRGEIKFLRREDDKE